MSAAVEHSEEHRGAFSSRKVFILAAIGSAVGLGNIWRFPYVAFENGGGAFIIPYLIALLTAGLPFLLLDYGLGHRYRGSAPLSFRRAHRSAEGLGWWQVGICFVIAVYYAAVIAWAARYAFFSLDKTWGDDPEALPLRRLPAGGRSRRRARLRQRRDRAARPGLGRGPRHHGPGRPEGHRRRVRRSSSRSCSSRSSRWSWWP